ncbi:MAG: hypothetical protein H7256_06140 [Bdellovibrio sp.]|nr:hypothetical protein [Bdellovibrio sp.]
MVSLIINDFEKAIISGYYIFSTNEFKILKTEACREANITIEKLDHILYQAVRGSIERFMSAFQLAGRRYD